MRDNTSLEQDGYAYPGQRIAQNGTPLGHGQGMTLRDYFAAHVNISGMNLYETYVLKYAKDPTVLEMASYAAKIKYITADAMIKARDIAQDTTGGA
jgi:hypothetical protein